MDCIISTAKWEERTDTNCADAEFPGVLFGIVDEFGEGFPRCISVDANDRWKEIMES